MAMAGASAALAGLVLVFLGVLVSAYQPLVGPQTPDRILRRFKTAAVAALGVFGLCLAGVVLASTWLVAGAGGCLFAAVVGVFLAQLVALAAIACYSTFGVLLRG